MLTLWNLLIEFLYPQVKKGEICVYFAIRGTIKSHEEDSLILIEYFLHDDINVLRSIFPSLVGEGENIINGKNVSIFCQIIDGDIYYCTIIPFSIILV